MLKVSNRSFQLLLSSFVQAVNPSAMRSVSVLLGALLLANVGVHAEFLMLATVDREMLLLDVGNPDEPEVRLNCGLPTTAFNLLGLTFQDGGSFGPTSLICGGQRSTIGTVDTLDECFILRPYTYYSEKFTWVGHLLTPRNSAGFIDLGDEGVWVLGGFNSDFGVTRSSEIITSAPLQWQLKEGPLLPEALRKVCATRIGPSEIFVTGDLQDRIDPFKFEQKAYIFDQITQSFSEEIEFNEDRFSAMCGTLHTDNGDRFVVMAGGLQGNRPVDLVEMYSVSEAAVTQGPTLPMPISSAGYSEGNGTTFYVMQTSNLAEDNEIFYLLALNPEEGWSIIRETTHLPRDALLLYFPSELPEDATPL